jgi:triacylglycerol lipase
MSDTIKGKGVEKEIPQGVALAIEEALTTPLSASIDSSHSPSPFTSSPIPLPERAHHPHPMRPLPPRLLSSLARTTMPTAGLTYVSAKSPQKRSSHGESSTAWLSASPAGLDDDPFPDLDPETGLPVDKWSASRADTPSLHLQRTITDLLATQPETASSSLLPFTLPHVKLPTMPTVPNLPSMPSLPTLPSLPGRSTLSASGSKRGFSSTSGNDDWGNWASGWWSGHKSKVDETLAEEDQAETVEEEQEKHRRKCKRLNRVVANVQIAAPKTQSSFATACSDLTISDPPACPPCKYPTGGGSVKCSNQTA